jgi:uncharacterized protein YceK
MLCMKMKGILLLAMSAVCLTGCGTVCNLASKDPQPYGGLAKDVDWFETPHSANGGSSSRGGAILLGLCGCEFASSGVADTLTFPLILCYEALIAHENAKNEGNYSKLPVEYSVGAVAAPPAPTSAKPSIPVEDKGCEGK